MEEIKPSRKPGAIFRFVALSFDSVRSHTAPFFILRGFSSGILQFMPMISFPGAWQAEIKDVLWWRHLVR